MAYAEVTHSDGTGTATTLRLMSDDETQPAKGTPHDQQSAEHQPPPIDQPSEERHRFAGLRDRARGISDGVSGGVVAAVLAGVLVGGAGGLAVGAVTSGDDGDDGRGHGQVDRTVDGGPDQRQGRPEGQPGQLPPGTAPEEDLSNS